MRSVAVTGTTRGVGKAITKVLLEDGYRLIAIDTSMRDLEKMKREMIHDFGEPGQKMELIEFDLREVRNIRILVTSIMNCLDDSSPLWGYVNNAAIYYPLSKECCRLLDISFEGMMEIFQVNLISAFFISREMFKLMRETKRGGSIVFISSVASKIGSLFNPVYAMTKAALANLAKSIASEGGNENIRCNAISPGVIETPMGSEIYSSKECLERRIEKNLIRRACAPEEVAYLVRYLLSDYAAYITGENLDLSGGRLIK